MKSFLPLILFSSLAFYAAAQGPRTQPRIVGQSAISTTEDHSITIEMEDLIVTDADDWFYPWGFSMTLHPGEHYTFQGHVVTPEPDFFGKLAVRVTVNDGDNDSKPYPLEIDVLPENDKPVITGNAGLTINEGQPLTILPSHLKVTDPDNKYPGDFTLHLYPGANYSFDGNVVTPDVGFSGTLSVGVTVNDGTVDSDIYALPVTVKAVDRAPRITGQVTLQVNEDQSLEIELSDLTVVDEDDNYPNGFTLSIQPGKDYTVSRTTVTPASNFFGKLSVGVTVSDGKNISKPFDLGITVTPVNDIPVLTNLETEPVYYNSPDVSVSVTNSLSVVEVDGDSIMFAEVGFVAGEYQTSADQLVFTPDPNSRIRGVFDVNTGIMTLLGQASPASYTKAIRLVQYRNVVPSAGVNKTLYFSVNDGRSDSERVERDLVFGRAAVALDIPTAFTPNGDLSNDTWKIIPLKSEEEYAGARVRVYNKAGTVVYESVGFSKEWDGRLNGELLPADTYFYTIDLNTNSPEGYLRGLVTILR